MPAPKKKPTRGTNRPFSAAAAAPGGPSGQAGTSFMLPNYTPPSTPASARAPAPRRKTTSTARRKK